ncbi:MAG TPA: hypothetical protein VF789_20690 [Thermoanaerobaculia bacterium]
MRVTKTLVIALLTAAGVACSPNAPELVMYSKDGVQFSYFSNWKVVRDSPYDTNPEIRAIDLDGPHKAIISIILFPPSVQPDLNEFAASVATRRASLTKESLPTALTETGTSQTTTGRISGHGQNGILQRYSITLMGQEVPHEARFFLVNTGQAQTIVMTQVASEDALKVNAAFDRVLDSLRIADRN